MSGSKSNQARISAARSDINSANARISECRSKKSRIEAKIERLKEAKQSIKSQKEEVSSKKYDASVSHAFIREWKGTRKDEYQAQVEEGLLSGYGTYYNQTDQALDEINDEITRLENEVYEQEGIIGWLHSRVNSLRNTIENLMN